MGGWGGAFFRLESGTVLAFLQRVGVSVWVCGNGRVGGIVADQRRGHVGSTRASRGPP